MTQRLTGMVKWFNNKAGFGFITVCGDNQYNGKDIFVHYSNIREENPQQKQYKFLVLGEYVECLIVKSENEKHEYHATDITGIFEGAIMCETRRLAIIAQSDRKPVQYNDMEAPLEHKPIELKRQVSNQSASTDLPVKTGAKRTYKPRKPVAT